MNSDYDRLAGILGHHFSDSSLLELALTHRSCGANNNERLEFLGDSILGLQISETLFKKFPKANEGELTRLRATLVKGETLGEIALELGLGAFIKLGGGERKSGGHRRQSILADTVEALIGAIYLDAGMSSCTDSIMRWYGNRLDQAVVSEQQQKDPKTRLQEYLQGRGATLPVYEVVSVTGDPHDQRFKVSCVVELLDESIYAESASRRTAEKEAAKLVLEKLGESRG